MALEILPILRPRYRNLLVAAHASGVARVGDPIAVAEPTRLFESS
jgi:hypothetical protein